MSLGNGPFAPQVCHQMDTIRIGWQPEDYFRSLRIAFFESRIFILLLFSMKDTRGLQSYRFLAYLFNDSRQSRIYYRELNIKFGLQSIMKVKWFYKGRIIKEVLG